mgnify:CR=1 FL=1
MKEKASIRRISVFHGIGCYVRTLYVCLDGVLACVPLTVVVLSLYDDRNASLSCLLC